MSSAPLPRRDWVLLPALALLTIALMAGAVEVAARVFLPESKSTTLTCLVLNDPTTGVRAIPNSSCSAKNPEGELATYQINSCGHRAGVECQPKAADTYRIVMVGSSYNYGMWVPRERSFGALLPQQLSQRSGRKVELYNEAMQWGFPRSVGLRFKEALAAGPDLILWPLTPADIAGVDELLPWTAAGAPPDAMQAPPAGLWGRLTAKSPRQLAAGAWKRLTDNLNGTHAVLLLQHAIYQSQSLSIKQYLQNPDSDYLRRQQSTIFAQHLASFTSRFEEVQSQAARAAVPVVVMLLPERAQAAMISLQQWPDGFDPFHLDNELRDIVTGHGGTYVDLLSGYRGVANPEQQFLPVDGHPTAAGHALIATLMSQALTDGAVPALKAAH